MYTVESFAALRLQIPPDSPSATQYLSSTSHARVTIRLPYLPDANQNPMFYVGVYALIGFGSVAVIVLSTITQYTGALRASRKLFKQLLVAVVCATFRWHDVTPQGRMLNRFSKDIETIDSSLASSFQAVNTSLASFFASVLTVSVIFPPFALYATVIGYFYYWLAIGYLNTGRDLRRMESNLRSPIFSGFSELLEGIVTVRAFSAEQRFLDDLHSRIDLTTQVYSYSLHVRTR
jgi:ABC-type multidrug transport system fused ATPase/permease subunit